MSEEHEMANPHDAPEESFAEDKGKGKGKAAYQDIPDSHEDDDDDDDDDDEEEDDDENENEEDDDEAEQDDGMAGIDLDNIVGQRTRGSQIDFAKAAEELGPEDEDDEDEDDDDFEPPADDTEMTG